MNVTRNKISKKNTFNLELETQINKYETEESHIPREVESLKEEATAKANVIPSLKIQVTRKNESSKNINLFSLDKSLAEAHSRIGEMTTRMSHKSTGLITNFESATKAFNNKADQASRSSMTNNKLLTKNRSGLSPSHFKISTSLNESSEGVSRSTYTNLVKVTKGSYFSTTETDKDNSQIAIGNKVSRKYYKHYPKTSKWKSNYGVINLSDHYKKINKGIQEAARQSEILSNNSGKKDPNISSNSNSTQEKSNYQKDQFKAKFSPKPLKNSYQKYCQNTKNAKGRKLNYNNTKPNDGFFSATLNPRKSQTEMNFSALAQEVKKNISSRLNISEGQYEPEEKKPLKQLVINLDTELKYPKTLAANYQSNPVPRTSNYDNRALPTGCMSPCTDRNQLKYRGQYETQPKTSDLTSSHARISLYNHNMDMPQRRDNWLSRSSDFTFSGVANLNNMKSFKEYMKVENAPGFHTGNRNAPRCYSAQRDNVYESRFKHAVPNMTMNFPENGRYSMPDKYFSPQRVDNMQFNQPQPFSSPQYMQSPSSGYHHGIMSPGRTDGMNNQGQYVSMPNMNCNYGNAQYVTSHPQSFVMLNNCLVTQCGHTGNKRYKQTKK